MPMLLLTASAIGVLLFGTGRRKTPMFLGQLALFGTALALFATLGLWGRPGAAFPGALVLDRFTLLIHLILLAACGITVLFSFRQIGPRHPAAGEYYALLLFSSVVLEPRLIPRFGRPRTSSVARPGARGRPAYGDTGVIHTPLTIALSFQPPGLPLGWLR